MTKLLLYGLIIAVALAYAPVVVAVVALGYLAINRKEIFS